tara:strand:- start:303 stop:1622 length:1320 start_codon:yes stop_codon:yes gene_type:complete
MAYIGRTPSGGRFAKMDDISSGFNGSANTFSLSLGGDSPNIASDAQVIISVGGVIQEPETDFAIRTNQIVFTSAPPSGASFFGILLGETFNALVPSTKSITGSHLAAGAINSNTIFGNGVITRHAMANGVISANTLISTGSITADLIATGAVGPTEIAAGAVSANTKLADGIITQNLIAAGNVVTGKINDAAVTGAKLASGAVSANTKLASGVVTQHAIASGNVVTSTINAGAVTDVKIATGTISSSKLATGIINANTLIGSGVIDASNIKNDAINPQHIAAGAINSNTFFAAAAVDRNAIGADAVGISELNVGLVASGNGVFTHNTHTFRNAQRARIETVSVGAANVTLDFANAQMFSITLGTNSNLNRPSNLTEGQSGTIFVVQDGTGSRTLSYSSVFDFVGGTAPTLTTTASAVDRIDYVVRSSSSIHAVASLALS